MSVYSLVLAVHSWLRWLVIGAGLVAAARGLTAGNRPWNAADDRAGRLFTLAVDVQLLLGVLLYFALSPVTRAAMEDFGGAMATSALRFWAVEHVFGMLIGLVLVHVGRARIRRAIGDRRRHRLAAIFFGLALLAMLASIPWPGLPNGRPLFRW